MRLVELLAYLRGRDVKLWADGGRLRYSAPLGVLTPPIGAELAKYKAEILKFLSDADTACFRRPPIRPILRAAELLPSFAEHRLWFIDQLSTHTSAYNSQRAVRLKGPLNVAALEQSLNEIVRRHEALRTTFPSVDGRPFQVITPASLSRLPVIDLRELGETTEREAERLVTEEAERLFDLAQGPLFRATLLCLADEDHILTLTMHHIVTDGWSMGVLFRELAALYEAFSTGKPSPLPELPIQYVDFTYWQREWLQGEVLERHLSYWKQQLEGAPAALELPTDRPRPAVQSFRGASQPLVLSKGLTEALKALSKEGGATLFMTLLAAFQTLLSRYTGQQDVVVGSPTAGRTQAELEGLIGFFINTLVLRTDLSGNPTFRELLGRVREVALGAYAHQDIPFEKLMQELQVERSMSYTPLFLTMFVLQNTPELELKLSGLTESPVKVSRATAKFDLMLAMVEGTEGLRGTLSYKADLFDAATMRRMAGNFQVLLEGIVANPDQRLSDLPLLTEAERHQLLVEWNATKADYSPQGQCIHELFEAQAEQTPEATAVVFPVTASGDRSALSLAPGSSAGSEQRRAGHLTYRELNRRANQLARHLRKLGVGPGVLVGICLERSLETVVGVLGVIKAGGAYLPLDPTDPQGRLRFMLADAQVPMLLTEERLAAGLPAHRALVVRLDADWEAIAQESDENPAINTTAEDLVYVIYTSGSTGRSNGVMIRHGSLVNAYLAWEDAYRLRSVSSHLQMANFSFDVFSGDLFRALCSGGKLVLCPRELLLAPEQLYELMCRERVDCAEFVPAVLRHLIQHLEGGNRRLDFMRLLICGSDSWYLDEYKKFRRFCGPETRLINSFGLTEATIDSSYFESATVDPSVDRLVPIGRPFAKTQLYILDRRLQLVPVGVTGELHVGGAGVARGYLNRAELTAAKFIPDPFSDEPGARLYKTGDLARRLPDGNIELLGRLDHQVKIRGFRIEPGEIEAVLAAHPAVSEAVVLAREDLPGDKRLVAYVVPAREQAGTIGELRDHLKQKLPEYMVPAAFVLLGEMPLTPNRKLDRRALPEPDRYRPELEGTFVAPRTPAEEALARIWAEVLRLERVGVHDNFFELGGHSLLATQVMSRLREAFKVELPLRRLFEMPTIAELTEEIEKGKGAGLRAAGVVPVPREAYRLDVALTEYVEGIEEEGIKVTR